MRRQECLIAWATDSASETLQRTCHNITTRHHDYKSSKFHQARQQIDLDFFSCLCGFGVDRNSEAPLVRYIDSKVHDMAACCDSRYQIRFQA